jgi:hypothetical protein
MGVSTKQLSCGKLDTYFTSTNEGLSDLFKGRHIVFSSVHGADLYRLIELLALDDFESSDR